MPYYSTGYSTPMNRSSLRAVNTPYAYFTAIFTPPKKTEEHRPRLIPLLFYICLYNSLALFCRAYGYISGNNPVNLISCVHQQTAILINVYCPAGIAVCA